MRMGPDGSRVSRSMRAAVLECLATSSMAIVRPRIPPPEPPSPVGMHRPRSPASRKTSNRSWGYSPVSSISRALGRTLSWARRRTVAWSSASSSVRSKSMAAGYCRPLRGPWVSRLRSAVAPGWAGRRRRLRGLAALADHPPPLALGGPAPDPVPLPAGQGIFQACLPYGALSADGLGHVGLLVGDRIEDVRVDSPTRCAVTPRKAHVLDHFITSSGVAPPGRGWHWGPSHVRLSYPLATRPMRDVPQLKATRLSESLSTPPASGTIPTGDRGSCRLRPGSRPGPPLRRALRPGRRGRGGHRGRRCPGRGLQGPAHWPGGAARPGLGDLLEVLQAGPRRPPVPAAEGVSARPREPRGAPAAAAQRAPPRRSPAVHHPPVRTGGHGQQGRG